MGDRWLTIITYAAIAGLVILNASGFTQILQGAGGVTTDYVKAVQGR